MRPEHWTAVAVPVFTQLLPMIRRRHAATVYLVLYHHASHAKEKSVCASVTKLCEWTGLDGRTINSCICYLEWRGWIIRIKRGTLHSREDLPVWRIPDAEFDMMTSGWAPVPSFIFTDYLPAHPACVLLPLLLYFQNLKKQNQCFPSVSTLRLMLGCWSMRMVYDALALLAKPAKWHRLSADLPLPVETIHRRVPNSSRVRHLYRVRAVYYHRENGKPPDLYISREFAEAFGVHGSEGPLPDYYYELVHRMSQKAKNRPLNPFVSPV